MERAESGRIHEEAHMPRVQPVVAAGDHDAGHVGRRRGRVGHGEAGAVRRRHDVAGHARRERSGLGRMHDIGIIGSFAEHERSAIRSQRVQLTGRRPPHDRGALHPAHRLGQEQALDGREGGRGTRGRRDEVVRWDTNVQRAQPSRLLEEANVV